MRPPRSPDVEAGGSEPATTDQLSLELDASLPHLPARLRPMLPRAAEAAFDSPDHLFEPSWGGRRALAFLEPAVEPGPDGRWRTGDGAPSLRLVDAGGSDLAERLPELGELALRVEARSAVLDGEIVATDAAGRADPAALEARLRGEPGASLAYLVFDLLYLDGRPLLGQPLERRRAGLRRVLRPGPELVAVPAIAGEGRVLHDAVTAQGLAGVLARQRTSPYLPGVRSRLWRFVAAGAGGSQPVTSTPMLPAAEAATEGEATTVDQAPAPLALGLEETGPPTGRPSILAVIRRLPLDEEPGEGSGSSS